MHTPQQISQEINNQLKDAKSVSVSESDGQIAMQYQIDVFGTLYTVTQVYEKTDDGKKLLSTSYMTD